VGFRPAGTFDTLWLIVGVALWAFFLLGVTVTWGMLGSSVFFGLTILALYLKHPRKKGSQELDEKLPRERWEEARNEYYDLPGVKEKIVEKQTS
jgi:hypothetical protein